MCHGACLGLGLAAMGTANYDIYDLLKENLMTRDDAVIGEAAGLAMGLVMIGTKSEDSLEDMLNVRTMYICGVLFSFFKFLILQAFLFNTRNSLTIIHVLSIYNVHAMHMYIHACMYIF